MTVAEEAARNLLRFAGLTPTQVATVWWDAEKRDWIIAQAEHILAALADPDWPRL